MSRLMIFWVALLCSVVSLESFATVTEFIDATGDGAGNILDQPLGVAVDSSGNVFVMGTSSAKVFKITPAGTITMIIDGG